MKFYLLLFLILIISSCATSVFQTKEKMASNNWEAKDCCSNPESVYYDKASKLVFVSNISGEVDKKDKHGWISIFNRTGRLISKYWIKDLNAPKGMRSYKNWLFVTDIDVVLKINIKNGRIEKKWYFPKSKFLNDIAIDSQSGQIYVSDTIGNMIYTFNINSNSPSPLSTKTNFDYPNGLLFYKNTLYVASWGNIIKGWQTDRLGSVYTLTSSGKNKTIITKSLLGNLDGIEINNRGNILVSDWMNGHVYEIGKNGDVSLLYKAKQGAADIGYISSHNEIIIPQMLTNRLISIKN